MTEGLVFYPGENFDPYDEDDREAVRLAMERDMYDQKKDKRGFTDEEWAVLARASTLLEEHGFREVSESIDDVFYELKPEG